VAGARRHTAPRRSGAHPGQTSLSTRWHDTQNQFYAIGSDSGLRGFQITSSSAIATPTCRSRRAPLPYPIWVLRLGGVVF